jgi:hypothetical protein
MFATIRTAVIAAVIWATFRFVGGSFEFLTLLGICAYASFITELAGLVLRCIVAGIYHSWGLPMSQAFPLKTAMSDLHVLAGANEAIKSVSSSLDILTLGFFILVAFGLSKSMGGLGFASAVKIVALPWLAWVAFNVVLALQRRNA